MVYTSVSTGMSGHRLNSQLLSARNQTQTRKIIKKIHLNAFGGPVVRVPALRSKGHGFESWSVLRSIFLSKKILIGKLCVSAGTQKYGSRAQPSHVKIPV